MNEDDHDGNTDVPRQNSEDELPNAPESNNRRDVLRRIGKYSAYAVPALLALTSKSAAAY